MGFAAYGFAREWMAASKIGPGGDLNLVRNVPTPGQYTLSMGIVGNASLAASWQGIKYVFRKKSKYAAAPRWLTTSVWSLVSLLFFAYLVTIADIWLHQSTRSVLVTTFSPSPKPTSLFSRQIDPAQCAAALPPPSASFSACASVSTGAVGSFILNSTEGTATLANISTTNEVAILPNTSIALLLPSANLRGQATYEASTFGAYATCAPISLECNLRAPFGTETIFQCLERPAFSGNAAAYNPGSSVRTLFTNNGTVPGEQYDYYGSTTQPLEFGVVSKFQSCEFSIFFF
jgi:hypothetical protein